MRERWTRSRPTRAITLQSAATSINSPASRGSSSRSPGKTSVIGAQPGHYVAGFAAAAQIPASPGHFAAGFRNIEQMACFDGEYQDQPGQAACKPADPGHFVDVEGAIAQKPCQPGTYQNLGGQFSCNATEPGHFAAGSANTAQQPCPFGQYQPFTQQGSCRRADPGHFAGLYIPDEQEHSTAHQSVPDVFLATSATIDQTPLPARLLSARSRTDRLQVRR